MKKRLLSVVLCLLLALFAGCSLTNDGDPKDELPPEQKAEDKKDETKKPAQILSANLMKGVTAENVTGKAADAAFTGAVADFSLNLFKKSFADDKNSLISPSSVLLALAMMTNGADGATLSELEAVLGGGIDIADLNKYLYAYVKNLPSGEKARTNIANSIWFKENGFTPNEAFLQTNADYYGAAAYKSAFDAQTVQDINGWASNATEGLIDKIVEEIPAEAVMYLINTVLFDAEWEEPYTQYDVADAQFTAYDGAKQPVQMMYMSEYNYLTDNHAQGFLKPYAGGNYSFMALLPDENVDIKDYVASLSGEKFVNIIKNQTQDKISTGLPKFEYAFDLEMSEVLKSLGIQKAFSAAGADFSKMGQAAGGNIYLAGVSHKTFITVDEAGTKAGAVTTARMEAESAPIASVILTRPFVYAIVDNATNLPIFMGTFLTAA